jgi:ubiquinone/menaquinone biosynthesis C-methylase UbiE
MSLPPEIVAHYADGIERPRLTARPSLELVRTQQLLGRVLPPPPARIVDVGGGPATYAVWLAGLGYEVHLVDAVPLHVAQALEIAADGPPFTAAVGDARALDRADASADAVLLLGPLYHLTDRADRVAALREACRVVHPTGVVAVAAISRYASLLDGLLAGRLRDARFAEIVDRDLVDGQHRNDANEPGWFTTAYFHHPDELPAEVREAGLQLDALYAVEGVGAIAPDLTGRLADPAQREQLLRYISATETEPTLLGLSSHLLAVARRPAASV